MILELNIMAEKAVRGTRASRDQKLFILHLPLRTPCYSHPVLQGAAV